MQRLLAFPLLFALLQSSPPSTQPAIPSLAGESHQIQSLASPGLLRPQNASNKDGAPLVLYPQQAWRCLTWKLESAGTDNPADYRLVNHFTHKTFRPTANTDGAAIHQAPPAKPASPDEIWRITPLPGNTYRIDHAASGKTLTVSPDETLSLAPWSDKDAQTWKMLPKPEKFTG